MHKTINPLFDSVSIQRKVKELGNIISNFYKREQVDDIVVVCVMNGAFMFFADLIRYIELPNVYCDFVRVSSYEGTTSTGDISVSYDLNPNLLKDKHVLIVEDIFDTGNTMKFLIEHITSNRPKSVKVCCFLYKQGNVVHDIIIDFIGFFVEKNAFVVGYGLDYNGLYRNIPYIGMLVKHDE